MQTKQAPKKRGVEFKPCSMDVIFFDDQQMAL